MTTIEDANFALQKVQDSGSKKRKPQTAPEIGEHTRQILEELNYDKTEIEKLENKKIIRT